MKKVFLSILVVFLCAAGGLLWTLQHPAAFSGIVGWSVGRMVPGVPILELRIGQQEFLGPERAVFQNISCRLMVAGRELRMQIKRLEILGAGSFVLSKKKMTIRLDGLDVEWGLGKVRRVAADLEISPADKGSLRASGPLTAEALAWDKVNVGKTSLRLSAGTEAFQLQDIRCEAYGGSIEGDAGFVLRPLIYTADLRVSGLDTSRLAELNEQIGLQLAGSVSGDVHLTGDTVRLGAVTANLSMPLGGKVNQELFKALTRYLSPSLEQMVLGSLRRVVGKVPVEVFSFAVKNAGPDHFSGEMHVASRAANLNLNLTHDVHVDGTWDGIAQAWAAIFK